MISTREVVIPYAPRPEQREMHSIMDAHRFTVFVAHRRMGKTVAVINQLIKSAVTRPGPKARFAYIGPQLNQTKDIAWSYLKHFTSPIPGMKVNESELWAQLPNGARIRIHGADRPDALRGTYLDGVVMDEVAQMKTEVWGEIIRPALADRQGFAVFIGTPKGQNLLYDLYQQADRQEGWGRALWRADQTSAIPGAELEAIRQELTANQYRQEFLCDFSASSDDALIPIDLAEEAGRRTVADRDYTRAPSVIGVDVARFGDDASVICHRQGLVCHPIQMFRGLPGDVLAERVAQVIQDHRPAAVNIDAGGPGASAIDTLRRWSYEVNEVQFGGMPGQPGKYFNKRAEMWCQLRDWLRLGGAIPKEDVELRADLAAPRYGFADDGHRLKLESKDRIKERLGRSPDRGDALALTFAVPVAAANPVLEAMGASSPGPRWQRGF